MKLCKFSGCGELIDDNEEYCINHRNLNRIKIQDGFGKLNYNKYKINDELRTNKKWRQIKKELLKQQHCCEICGNENHLEVHHIKKPNGNPSLFFDVSNLVVVCSSCHKKLSNYQKKKYK